MSDEKKPTEQPEPKASGANVTDEMSAAFSAALNAVEAVKRKTGGPELAPEPTPTPAPATSAAAPEPAAKPAPAPRTAPAPRAAPASKPAPSVAAVDTATAEALAAAKKEIEEWKARAYRTTADLENTRKRHAREKEDLRKFAVEGLLKDILPVVDNLERAAGHAPDLEDPLAKGVQMVLKQFTKVVGDRGAVPFDAAGEAFDPTVHEAMTQVHSEDVAPGHVVQVFQRGWMLNERLLRPAMVVVASPDSTGVAPEVDEDAGDPTEPPAAAAPVEE